MLKRLKYISFIILISTFSACENSMPSKIRSTSEPSATRHMQRVELPKSKSDVYHNKYALIIGNSDYKGNKRLVNPVKDARKLAIKLKGLGFDLIGNRPLLNANRTEIRRAVARLRTSLQQNRGVGLVFYAGHAMQSSGKNYLLPLKADIQDPVDIESESVSLEWILKQLHQAQNPMNFVLLDACRNNPYRHLFSSTRGDNIPQGLTSVKAPAGTLISYATAENEVAADGNGNNSPYTDNLLKALDIKGLTAEQLFKTVRNGVMADTQRYLSRPQVPAEYTSLSGADFYFNGGQSDQWKKERELLRQQQLELQRQQAEFKRKQDNLNQQMRQQKAQQENNKPNRLNTSVVRNNQQRIGQYIVNSNNTVKDTKTGLMWKRCAEGLSGKGCLQGKRKTYTWDKAVDKFKNINYAGYSDWRLPTREELRTLVYCSNGTAQEIAWDKGCAGGEAFKKNPYQRPTINQQVFPNTAPNTIKNWQYYVYWSSSPRVNVSNYAWSIYFYYGLDNTNERSSERFVRLVRVRQ